MPPELIAFMQANGGRLPTSELELQAFLEQANLSNLTGPFPPGAGQAPPPPIQPPPLPGAEFPSQFGPEFPPVQMPGPILSPQLDPQVIPPGVGPPSPIFSPDIGTQGGAPLPFPGGPGPIPSPDAFPGGPGPLLSPDAGAPGGAPLPIGPGPVGAPSTGLGPLGVPPLPAPPPGFGGVGGLDPGLAPTPGVGGPSTPSGATTASEEEARGGGPKALDALAGVFGDIAGGVARARLGGPEGFSFSQGPAAPPAAPPSAASAGPISLGGFGALPDVGRTGSGDVLTTLGAQQQQDVAGQRQAAAQLAGPIAGVGAGGIGLLLSALSELLAEEPPSKDKRITIGGSSFDPTLRASALGSPAVTGRR